MNMTTLKFDFDETKATQVIGVLSGRCGGVFDYYLAMKALYALDRSALLRWGQPVVGGDYRMLPFGPVNQSAMDATKEAREGFFLACFERSGNEIRMERNPGVNELSRAEVRLAEEICDEWKDLSFNAAHQKATSFPECIGLEKIAWIPIERILSSEGKTPEQIDELANEATELQLLKHPPAQ